MPRVITVIQGGRVLQGRALTDNQASWFDNCWQAVSETPTDRTLFQTVWKIPQDWVLSPGFVDIHIHGMAGQDVMDGDPESLAVISEALIQSGVTSWLGTTMTMSKEKIQAALSAAAAFKAAQAQAADLGQPIMAKLEGIHLEGPYISPKLKGAQNEAFILPLDFEQFERDFYQPYPELIRHLTCAPEMEGALSFIEAVRGKGINIAMGHTGCGFEEALAAKAAGASHITHFFNAMAPIHHREPGLAGAGLMTDLSVEWIADGVHFRPEWFEFLLKTKGEKGILVTDAMCAAGLSPGSYELGGQRVVVDLNSARLTDGVLAGSVLTMDQAVRNMVSAMPNQLAEVLYAASTGPAAAVGLPAGRIVVGSPADAVLLNGSQQVMAVWTNGQLVFKAKEAEAFIKG